MHIIAQLRYVAKPFAVAATGLALPWFIVRLVLLPYPPLYWVESAVALALTAGALLYLIRIGFGELHGLRGGDETRVYVLVFAIGVAASCLASIAAYGAYRLGFAEYQVDPLVSQQAAESGNQTIIAEDSVARMAETLRALLARGLDPVRLERTGTMLQRLGGAPQFLATNLPELGEWSLFVEISVAGGVPGPTIFLFSSPRQSLEVSGFFATSDGLAFGTAIFEGRRTFQRAVFIDALGARIDGAISLQGVAASRAAWPSAAIFVYHGAMTFLGASPRYFVPVNWVARSFSTLAAIFRVLFAALVLSMFVRKWSTVSATENTTSEEVAV